MVAEKYGSISSPVLAATDASAPSRCSARHSLGGAPVLPDDGAMERPSGRALPQHRRLALIGDADGGDVARRDAGLRHRLAADGDGVAPNLLGVVLDPAVLRDNIARSSRCAVAAHAPAVVEQQRAARGRALVDGEDVARHALFCHFTRICIRADLEAKLAWG